MGAASAAAEEIRQAEAAYEGLLTLAREDSALFCELVLTDEDTGSPIELTPMHEEWHATAAKGRNMVIWAFPESGKSQQMSIGRTLWLLGRNPRLRIAILAAAERQVKKIIASIRRHIEGNHVLHRIFPNLKRGDLWTDSAISIMRPGNIKDPSVQAVSPGGAFQGARVNVLLIDDVLVEENTRTAYQRQKTETWIRTSAFSRLGRKSQVIVLANAFHPDDLAHVLARQGWWAKKYPVLDEAGNSTYPSRWPLERIEHVRAEEYGPTEFARMMMCQARADEDARFQAAWIDKCKARSNGYPLFKSLEHFVDWVGPEFWEARGIDWDFRQKRFRPPPGFLILTGVDLGISQRDSADPSVLFTVLVWPDGTRQVLDIRRGRWQSPLIIKNVVDVYDRFKSSFFVENNAAQQYLVQWIHEDHPWINVKGFRTGKNKRDLAYGVESIAGELEDGMWLIPNEDGAVHPNVKIWEQEMLFYSPDGHTGDCLMASWIAREAARAYGALRRRRTAEVRVLGGKKPPAPIVPEEKLAEVTQLPARRAPTGRGGKNGRSRAA
jgi:hypothetical protein